MKPSPAPPQRSTSSLRALCVSVVSTSRPRWPLTIGLPLLLAASVLGYRAYSEYQHRCELLAEVQSREKLQEPLEQTVSIQFGGEVPLAQWLAEFTRQTGIKVEVVEQSRAENDGPGPRAFVQSLTKTTPLWLDIPDLTARAAIQLLADCHEVRWMLRGDGVIVLGNETVDDPSTAHALEFLQSPHSQDELVERLEQSFGRMTWDWDMGGNYVHSVPGGAVSVQPDRDQRQSREFLKRLIAARERIQAIPAFGLPADDPAWQPIFLAGEQSQFERLQAALDQPITLHVTDMPWGDYVAKLAELVKFPITLHPRAKHWTEGQHQLVTCQLRETPLRDALNLATGDHALEFFAGAEAKALIVSTHEFQISYWNRQLLLAYDVSDLIKAEDRRQATKELCEVIRWSCAPLTWQDVGGPAIIAADAEGELLLISQRLDLHPQVQHTLAAIREVRLGARESNLPGSLAPAARDMRARLQQTASLKFSGQNLRDTLKELNERFELNLRMDSSLTEETSRFYQPIRCYLPPRPLHENLAVLLHQVDCQLVADRDILWVVHRNINRWSRAPVQVALQNRAFNLRPWIEREQQSLQLVELIQKVVDAELWQRNGGPASCSTFREALVVHGPVHLLARVKEFVEALQEHLESGVPRKWCGEPLVGEALNRPLKLFAPTLAHVQRQGQLEQKLQTRVTLEPASMKLWDALATLASRYELPLVMNEDNATATSQARVQVAANDQPLGEVLQALLGDPDFMRLRLGDGCVMVVTKDDAGVQPDGHLYSVNDLLAPRGPLQPGTLIRTLKQAFDDSGLRTEYPRLRLHFGNLLWLEHDTINQQKLEQSLRKLRNGELKPLPANADDVRGPYDIDQVSLHRPSPQIAMKA